MPLETEWKGLTSAVSSNGRTTDSDSVYLGSSPGTAAIFRNFHNKKIIIGD